MATKGCIRDFTSSYVSHLKKEKSRRICELERKCHILEKQLKGKYAKSVEKELRGVRVELNNLLRRRAEFIMHRVRQSYYFNGSKPSRLLALKLKQSESRASINTINMANNKFTFNPKEINVAFHSFYREL